VVAPWRRNGTSKGTSGWKKCRRLESLLCESVSSNLTLPSEIPADPISDRYIRQARAYLALHNESSAMDILCRGLRVPSLSFDGSLVDLLINLQTFGKGLPTVENELEAWVKNILYDDPASQERTKGLGGKWRNRIERQRELVKRD
jgi:hypothetical protein